MEKPLPRILVVAGSDPSGGAGIQADIKTITALGGYAMTAITALTVQNSQGVTAVQSVSADFVAAQMTACLDDIGANIVKTGMLYDAAIIQAVADTLQDTQVKLVLDPVMVAKGGHALMEQEALAALKDLLIPRAFLITPNIPEAEQLTGITIHDADTAQRAGRALIEMGAKNVLIKGGHLPDEILTDWLITPEGMHEFTAKKLDSKHTHGTGCTMASAIACELGQGNPLVKAVQDAHQYVQRAIQTAPGFGGGHGPLNHLI